MSRQQVVDWTFNRISTQQVLLHKVYTLLFPSSNYTSYNHIPPFPTLLISYIMEPQLPTCQTQSHLSCLVVLLLRQKVFSFVVGRNFQPFISLTLSRISLNYPLSHQQHMSSDKYASSEVTLQFRSTSVNVSTSTYQVEAQVTGHSPSGKVQMLSVLLFRRQLHLKVVPF